MEKKRIYPENTPPGNIPYNVVNPAFRYRAIVPADDSIVMEVDANGVLYVSSDMRVATPDATSAVSIADFTATITATCATEGAEIYYTTDGSIPTINSNHYTGPFAILGTETMLRFMAVKNGYVNSLECVLEKAATPVVTLEDGYITATCATEGATIFYATSPETIQEYFGPIEAVPGSCYEFIAFGSHWLFSEPVGIDVPYPYFHFIAERDGSTISLVSTKSMPPSLEISTDGGITFDVWREDKGIYDEIVLAEGETVFIRGINDTISGNEKGDGTSTFSINGPVRAEGNILSLLFGESPDVVAMSNKNAYAFAYLFRDCKNLLAAPQLPAISLAPGCYLHLFSGCTGLTAAPQLPATDLAPGCYEGLFSGCTGLTAAPQLPATKLAPHCYQGLFHGCTGLTAAPQLPATMLEEFCYQGLFYGCTGLTAAPQLPATTLVHNCYVDLFGECTALEEVTVYAEYWDTNHALGWLQDVSQSGSFRKPQGTTIPEGDPGGIPSGWTVIDL